MALSDVSGPDDAPVARVKTVVVVDDHATFADSLALVLDAQPDFSCVGTAGSVAEAERLVRALAPDLVVMDIELGGEDGLEGAQRLRRLAPSLAVVVVTAHRDIGWVARASHAGANAFVSKLGPLGELLNVLRRSSADCMAVGPTTFFEPPVPQRRTGVANGPLSSREREVVALLAQGFAPADIAPMLGINVSTTRGYVKAIYTKLNVKSQVQAVLKAQQLGLVDVLEAH